MSDDVQRRIFARRARFIALTFAGVGCTPGETAPPPVVARPVPEPDASSVVEPQDAGAGAVDAGATVEAAPVDAGVSAATQLRYDRVRARVAELRARITATEAAMAKARPVATPAGKADWLTIVQDLDDTAEALGMMAIYCPSPPRPETTEFMRWTAEQGAKVQAALDAARAKAHAKLKDATTSGEARYEALSQENRSARPSRASASLAMGGDSGASPSPRCRIRIAPAHEPPL